jgi:hypothetical protein
MHRYNYQDRSMLTANATVDASTPTRFLLGAKKRRLGDPYPLNADAGMASTLLDCCRPDNEDRRNAR